MSLFDAVTCLTWFNANNQSISTLEALRKLYKRAALVVHSDRPASVSCPYSMVDVNRSWERISAAKPGEMELIFARLASGVEPSVVRADPYANDPLHQASVPAFFTVDTLARRAWNIVDESTEDFRWFGPSHVTYFKDIQLEYAYWSGSACMLLRELSDAFRQRKTCVGFRVVSENGDHEFPNAFYELLRQNCGFNPRSVMEWLKSLPMVDLGPYRGTGAEFKLKGYKSAIRIYPSDTAAHKVFSPFALHQLNPLQEMPKKWTVAHLKRLIGNGQFRGYKVNYYLTDDFAHDNACQLRRGYVQNPIASLSKMMDDELWLSSTVLDNGNVRLSFGAHSNDGRSLIVELNNRYSIVDFDDAEEQAYLSGQDCLAVA
jgi:hypothetical protein